MPIMSILRNSLPLLRTKVLDAEPWPAGVTNRLAGPADAAALRRLADLDEHAPIVGDALVAEVGGELWAAAGIDHAAAIADPFRPSGELALFLLDRAGRVRRARRAALRSAGARRAARQAA